MGLGRLVIVLLIIVVVSGCMFEILFYKRDSDTDPAVIVYFVDGRTVFIDYYEYETIEVYDYQLYLLYNILEYTFIVSFFMFMVLLITMGMVAKEEEEKKEHNDQRAGH